ncbi:TPA: YSIRK-type signal peptide-containing protein, partial [Staphylococcus aureus]|nr:YSIRK-type signal peptide-containing protein [Staphylococcus aureus]HDM4779498.1 YSIRK-type signal peptide-containing protein [Staphylococcus aureus]HEI9040327.1 YSIRK-type signal peptide-containing protein [Staphylococcus aureus]
MKKSKKRLDFLPNKLNKYSIRRFSVGTASILVGATLLFGINNEAHAAEQNEAPVKEEATNDNSASEVSQETPVKEEATNDNSASEASQETPVKEEATNNN